MQKMHSKGSPVRGELRSWGVIIDAKSEAPGG